MQLDDNRHYRPMSKDEVLSIIEERGVQYISFWFADVLGAVKSVVTPASELENVVANGIHFDGSSVEGSNRVAESDMVLVPDLDTFTLLPWNDTDEDRTARIICTAHTTFGEPSISDSRYALIRALHQAEEMGFIYKTGMELEFYLFRLDSQGNPILSEPHDRAGYFDHTDEETQRVRRTMLQTLREMGIRVDSAHSETGSGQHEIDFQYSHALVSADHILTARIAMKTIAQQHGLHCTFMPRPLPDMPGSGMHTHQSLHDCDTGENLFAEPSHEYGLSEVARHFLAGQLVHARAMSAVLSPLVNSYKRLGNSLEAPSHVTWAQVNRGALIRVPSTAPGKESHTRLELRCPDPSANPYLSKAVMLMAGLDGIRHKMELQEPLEELLMITKQRRARGQQMLPLSLAEALEELSVDPVVMNALGAFIGDHYLTAKKKEVEAYNSQITQWEVDQYLNRY
jgi:glutamine synthetase